MPSKTRKTNKPSKLTIIAIIVLFVAIISVVLTIELSRLTSLTFIRANRERIIAGELALYGILLVELLGRITIHNLQKDEHKQSGVMIRSILRAVLYLLLTASVISVLASDPALAVGIGSITGIVIGFAGQNLFGNLMAGVVLSLTSVIRIGQEITVMGSSGRVIEVGHIYSILDAGDYTILVPNVTMLSNAIKRQNKSNESKHEQSKA
jgi:small conductance mechanosensitive channel